MACKEENQVPLGAFRTWVKYVEKGTFPDTRRYFSVLRCNHCDDAPCVTICPTVALYRRPDGIVDFDGARCIGCKSCMQACPYDALYIDPTTNTAAKCHYCAHRLEVGLEPACVIVCPEQAIIAGDLDDPRTEIARLVAREQVEVRKPEQGTRPKVFYVGADSSALTPPLQRSALDLHVQPALGRRDGSGPDGRRAPGQGARRRRHAEPAGLRCPPCGASVGLARVGLPVDEVDRGRCPAGGRASAAARDALHDRPRPP